MKKILSINDSIESLQKEIKETIQELNKENKPILLLCFGSALLGGDNFAPKVGSLLINELPITTLIVGTMQQPLHRLNSVQRLAEIKQDKFFIIALGLAYNDKNNDFINYKTLTIHDAKYAVGAGYKGEVMQIGDMCINLITKDTPPYSKCENQALKMTHVLKEIF